MEDRVYTLYLYKWTDGSYYIGRTFTSSGRFNNSEKYKQQYVYKKMLSDPSYKAIECVRSLNLFKIYYLEAQCIKECWKYTKCLNANTEENWFKNATRDWCTLNNNDLNKFNSDFNEFLAWKSEESNDCIEYILDQINS